MTTITETVSLSTPIKTHSGDLSTLTLKEPTAGAFLKYGEPFKARVVTGKDDEQSVEFEYDYKVFGKFLVDMIVDTRGDRIDDLILGSMRAADFYTLRQKATNLILGLVGEQNPSQPSVV